MSFVFNFSLDATSNINEELKGIFFRTTLVLSFLRIYVLIAFNFDL